MNHHHHRRSLLLLLLLLCLLIPHPLSTAAAPPNLTVTPTTLNRSGDTVTITWSGVASPSELDWIGIYSPPDSSHSDFIGYKFLSHSSPDTWHTGSGSVSIPLTNLRSDYSFRIFRWTRSEINQKKHDHDQNPLPGTAHLLAESVQVGFGLGRGPEQVHLAYTDNEEEMRVMFVSGDGEERKVRWGEREGGAWSHVAAASVGRYEREDMCDAPANESVGWRDPGWIHDAVMTGLKKGVKYFYQVMMFFAWTKCCLVVLMGFSFIW